MISTLCPDGDEYSAAFAGYVQRIAKHEDIKTVLVDQLELVANQLSAIPESRGDYRYAPGKWSIKEIIGHLSDTERVFAYRALRIARGDATPLPSFDDQGYVAEMKAEGRTMGDIAAEWADVRRASITLFQNLPVDAWARRGTASNQVVSVRALAYIIAGHARHHMETLEERYTR